MDQLRGQELKLAFSAATGCLEEYRDTVNALNVFPVPDGDTGTNMLLTMRAAVQRASDECPDEPKIRLQQLLAVLVLYVSVKLLWGVI